MPAPANRVEFDVRALRESLRLTQSEFWNKLGITQSGGSRYENGRRMPRSVWVLINQFYLGGRGRKASPAAVPASHLSKTDVQLLRYLDAHPGLRKYLLSQARDSDL